MIQRIKNCIEKYDDILSWKIWESIKAKSSSFGSFQLWTSLIFTVVFYMQFSSLSEPSFLLRGDNLNICIMQIYNTILLNQEFIFKGIDFLTHGGASEYFLRPNIAAYNPIILFLSYFVDVDNVKNITKFIIILLILHSFLACYFTQKLSFKFLKFDKYLALFAGVSFAFSYLLIDRINIIIFFFIICLMPVTIYCVLLCFKNFKTTNIALSSFVLIALYTSGYIPLTVFSVIISFIFCLFYLYTSKNFTIKNFLKILLPFLISGIVVLPLFLNVLDFISITKPGDTNLYSSALEHGTNPNMFLKLFFHDVYFSGKQWHGGMISGESQVITIGILPFLILILFLYSKTKTLCTKDKALVYFCLIIFGFIFFAMMGIYSPFSYFMHKIPILGESRIYTRQLAIVSLFLFIATAKLLDATIENKNISLLKGIFTFFLVVIFILASANYLGASFKVLSGGNIIMQLIMVEVFLAILILSNNKKFIVVCSALIMFLVPLTYMYKVSTSKIGENGFFSDTNYKVRKDLREYMKNNSAKDKKIVKYHEATPYPGSDSSVLNRNTPWMMPRKDFIISSYSGYEGRMSSPNSYKRLFRTGGWTLKTGGDFLILKKGMNFKYLSPYIDLNKLHPIKGIKDTFITTLKIQEPENTVLNNGYIRVLSKDSDTKIENFETNNANRISFRVESDEISTIQYLFWPNKHMKPYINDSIAEFKRINGLDVLEIPKGKQEVKIVYKNFIMDIFLFLYFGFISVFIFVILNALVKFCLNTYKTIKYPY